MNQSQKEQTHLLEVRGLTKRFGSLKAIDNLTMYVEEGKITGLIGPNGAGKTTLFNVIAGDLKPDKGKVFFKNKDISSLKPYQIARMGIGRTYQLIRIFSQMTVMENLMTAASIRKEATEEQAMDLLEPFDLIDKRNDYAGELSIGQQKILSVLRILMLNADFMLLDELAAGVNATEQEKLLDFIRHLCDHEGKTALIIEHDMDVIMGYSDKVICVSFGEKIAEGSCEEIQNNEQVIEAYFGG